MLCSACHMAALRAATSWHLTFVLRRKRGVLTWRKITEGERLGERERHFLYLPQRKRQRGREREREIERGGWGRERERET